MRFRMFKYLLLFVVLTFTGIGADAAIKEWETVKSEIGESKAVVREADFEIRSQSGTIIVATRHQMQVQVFTILGRLVVSDSIPAGVSRLQLASHGIYIVKIGSQTYKIAV